ncbi:unnamed protein product [Ostreobium quekettii]|uniref:Uncharacterized protein n=1 Tax=Ostreobium quekettii TaxID=121088 RepID=A0A8S1IWA9_9CHLO|nr:unnamed protein product [Ostreobium quekettii]
MGSDGGGGAPRPAAAAGAFEAARKARMVQIHNNLMSALWRKDFCKALELVEMDESDRNSGTESSEGEENSTDEDNDDDDATDETQSSDDSVASADVRALVYSMDDLNRIQFEI